MADPNPPTGVTPLKPAEPAKVQPKKETVRINLPPKPTAAPTIKIPSPSAVAATPAAASAAAPVAAAPATATPAAPTAAPRAAVPATNLAGAPARPATRPAPAARGVSMLEQVLTIVAAVVGVAVLVFTYMLGA